MKMWSFILFYFLCVNMTTIEHQVTWYFKVLGYTERVCNLDLICMVWLDPNCIVCITLTHQLMNTMHTTLETNKKRQWDDDSLKSIQALLLYVPEFFQPSWLIKDKTFLLFFIHCFHKTQTFLNKSKYLTISYRPNMWSREMRKQNPTYKTLSYQTQVKTINTIKGRTGNRNSW